MSDRRFYVYAVELRPLPGDGPSIYIGSSAFDPKERLRHHLTKGVGDVRATSRHVRRRGVRLRPDLYKGMVYDSRGAAKDGEQQLRTRLERRGFKVFGSCRPSDSCRL